MIMKAVWKLAPNTGRDSRSILLSCYNKHNKDNCIASHWARPPLIRRSPKMCIHLGRASSVMQRSTVMRKIRKTNIIQATIWLSHKSKWKQSEKFKIHFMQYIIVKCFIWCNLKMCCAKLRNHEVQTYFLCDSIVLHDTGGATQVNTHFRRATDQRCRHTKPEPGTHQHCYGYKIWVKPTVARAKIIQQNIEKKTGKNLLWYMDIQILFFQTP